MSRSLVVSDLQAHNWSAYATYDADGRNSRLTDVTAELARLRQIAVQRRLRQFVILGDVFQARNALEVSVMNAIHRELWQCHQDGLQVILLVGNHDRTGLGTETSLEVFKPFCTVIDTPRQLDDALYVPFMPDPKDIVLAVQNGCRRDSVHWLFLHCAVKKVALQGNLTWQEGIPLACIPFRVRCLIGHFHKFTVLRRTRVFYLGSLLHVDWGDTRQKKFAAMIIGTKLHFLPTHGPKFIACTWGKHQGVPIAGNFLRVHLANDHVTPSAVHATLMAQGARYVEVIPPAASTTFAAHLPAQERVNAQQLLEAYVRQAPTPLDKARLVEVGTAALHTVREPQC